MRDSGLYPGGAAGIAVRLSIAVYTLLPIPLASSA
jgi:hypothetical protein